MGARRKESGQALTEYAIMLAMFAGMSVIMVVLLGAFSQYGWRLVALVGLPYP